MKLSIVVVNYNTEKDLFICINSIRKQDCSYEYEIIVVDNSNSIDVSDPFYDSMLIINPNYNLGFGCANNLAVENSNGEYILFLNPDCSLINERTLQLMIDYMLSNVEIGVLTTRVTQNNVVIEANYKYPKQKYLTQKIFNNLPGDICWVLGAVMMVKKSVFVKEVNGFDQDFFLYGEETDLCLRYRKAGYVIKTISDITVEHIGGASETNSDIYDYTMRKQRGLHLFLYKHYSIKDFKKILLNEMISAMIKIIVGKIKMIFSSSNYLYERNKYYKAIYDSAKVAMFNVEDLFFKKPM